MKRKTLYFMTLLALLAASAAAFLIVPNFNGANTVSAQSKSQPISSVGIRSNGEKATEQMISYALSNRTGLSDMISALNQLPCHDVDDAQLGGRVFKAGVYCVSSARIAGEMKLDAENNANAIFIFNVKGALDTDSNSRVSLVNEAKAHNVFFVTDTASIGDNSDFNAAILSKNSVVVNGAAKVAGRISSLSGDVVNAPQSPEGGTDGTLEICKVVTAGSTLEFSNRVFTFTVTGANIPTPIVRNVRAGFCSAPFDVPNGPAVVTESPTSTNPSGSAAGSDFTLTGVRAIQGAGGSSSSLGTVNLSARTANITVGAGGVANQLAIEFTNTQAFTGFVEICKRAAFIPGTTTPDPDVQGTFTFTINGNFQPGSNTALQTYTAPVGQCTGAIAVTTAFAGPGTTRSGPVTVNEIGQPGSFLVAADTIPTDRLISGPTFDGNGGGSVVVRVFEGDQSNETIVNFRNQSRPGLVKVCKIAGPGITPNALFQFTVTGTGPNAAPANSPNVAVTRTFNVAAGPAAEGGNCAFVPGFGAGLNNSEFQTFVIGTTVRVIEDGQVSPATTQTILISRIRSTSGGSLLTSGGRIVGADVPARRDVVEVEFTNFVFRPSILKVCKITANPTAIPLNTQFTFTVVQNSPTGAGGNLFPAFSTQVTVNAGAASQGGNCTIVDGGGLIGGSFNQGSSVTITENAAPGTIVTNITATPPSNIPPFVPGARATTLSGANGIVAGVTQVTFTNNTGTTVASGPTSYDFDGDGRADVSVFRPASGIWYVNRSRDGFMGMTFGQSSDRIVPADYDGDGKTDEAVYRGGTWYIQRSTLGFTSVSFGDANDLPVPADYDGDGKTDVAVYRPSNGTWYRLNSLDGQFVYKAFGIAEDKPTLGDFDGDGKADLAVFRPSTGTWYRINSSNDAWVSTQFGDANDKVVPADYDNDGKTDIAVFRPSTGAWYLLQSRDGFTGTTFGAGTDVPVPADFDGDGKADVAVYRPSTGAWYVLKTTGGVMGVSFGADTDKSIPNAFVR